MPIRVKCESCKKTLSVKDHLAGKKIKCPVCQSVVVVNAAETAKESPDPAPGVPVTKKQVTATKQSKALAPSAEKPKTNGTPGAPVSPNGNGVAPAKPEAIEPPPENVEAEALAAFADEPPPPEEDTTPKTIDFKCQYCDENVQLPIELAGKQSQCPNPECRRIVKVPLPKVEGKKDWRKMDRKGPAAAIISQPEELKDAWGTETTTRARQASLAQAGAIEKPKAPPVGAFGWLRRGLVVIVAAGLGYGAVVGVIKLRSSNQQHHAVKEIKELAEGADPKIKNLLHRAEAHRALAVLYLREPNGAIKSMQQFQGAHGLVALRLKDLDATGKESAVNEPFVLMDLAFSQIELGGTEDEAVRKEKQKWDDVRGIMKSTLQEIPTPEAQVIALRELGTRLIDRDQKSLAWQLAGNLANFDANAKTLPVTYRQQIALILASGSAEAQQSLPKEPDLTGKEELNANLRVGFAEGYARKGDFEKAETFAKAKGYANDRFDACMGVSSVALLDPRHKAEADRFFKAALAISKEKGATPTPWEQLQMVRLAARLEDVDSVKEVVEKLPAPFKLRAQLEIFLAKCEKSTATPDDLADLEANDKTDKEATTLGLAWAAFARANGATRDQNRKTFDQRVLNLPPGLAPDAIRPMVDIGSYLGSKK